jgi:L-asparaginase II
VSREELAGVPAVDVWRGPRVESIHAVAACVCTDDGEVRYQRGTIDVPIFLRSAAKPFIAAAAVRAGVVERFGLEPREIAVMAASHSGEPGHVDAVASILAKIGASEADLQCGVQYPGSSQLRHNCSGKHAGILALSRVLDAPFATYLDVDHPAERAILALCERAFDDRFDADRIGIDGCGIPVIALTLRHAATGFARLATLRNLAPDDRNALAIVRDAMVAHPWYVAGTAQFDTDLMRAGDGAIVAKGGAEGVHASGLIDAQLGVVLKVIDGARRAVPPAAVALLDELGALGAGARAALAPHARASVTNIAGRVVGEIVARDGPGDGAV